MLPLGPWVKANDLVPDKIERATGIEPRGAQLGTPQRRKPTGRAKNESGREHRLCWSSQQRSRPLQAKQLDIKARNQKPAECRLKPDHPDLPELGENRSKHGGRPGPPVGEFQLFREFN